MQKPTQEKEWYFSFMNQRAQSFSRVQLSATPWTVAHWAPVHSILQARLPVWVAISSSRGSSSLGTEPISLVSPVDSLPLSHLGNPTKMNQCLSVIHYVLRTKRDITAHSSDPRIPFPGSPSLWGVIQQRRARARLLCGLREIVPLEQVQTGVVFSCKRSARCWIFRARAMEWAKKEILGRQVPWWKCQVHSSYQLSPFGWWEQKWSSSPEKVFLHQPAPWCQTAPLNSVVFNLWVT